MEKFATENNRRVTASTGFATLTPACTVDIDNININYTENILSDEHLTVVLIHGFGASLETWSDIYPLLCPFYSVIRMDLKGSGFSSKPKDSQYSPSDQALLLLKFLKELRQTNVVLVGHSLGGGVALLTYFESLLLTQGISVKGLILIDSAGYSQSLPFFVSTVQNPVTRFVSHLMSPEQRVRFVLNKIIKLKRRVTPDRVRRYSYFLDKPGSRYALYQTAKQIVPRNVSELSSKFSTISVPTLILWGADDPVISVEYGHRFNQDIPNSRLVVLADTGHIPQEERPSETFSAMNQFLKTLR
jgi:pimeloyl-ACP methyl ester carboxylesterase